MHALFLQQISSFVVQNLNMLHHQFNTDFSVDVNLIVDLLNQFDFNIDMNFIVHQTVLYQFNIKLTVDQLQFDFNVDMNFTVY